MKRNTAHQSTRGTLTFDVRECEWSARITGVLDEAEPALLLSLPRGLFLAHAREMCRLGTHPGPSVASDTEYLSEIWGFTRADCDDMTEIADVALVTLRVSDDRLSVHLAGYPWLLSRVPLALPEEWRRSGQGRWCLLGICFEVDLDAPDADDRFLSELANGEASLGQVNIVTSL